jgi:hypothetical protein
VRFAVPPEMEQHSRMRASGGSMLRFKAYLQSYLGETHNEKPSTIDFNIFG